MRRGRRFARSPRRSSNEFRGVDTGNGPGEWNMRRFVVKISYLFSLVGEFAADMRAQRRRTALTIFGIVWGTAAVVLMMALGDSVKKQNMTNIRGMGDGIILVFPGTTTKPYRGFGVSRRINLHESDVRLLRRKIPEISRISEEYSSWNSVVRYGRKKRSPLVAGVNPDYGEMRNEIPRPGGRFINENDMRDRRRVVFLGYDLKKYLFGEREAVGKFVYIDNVPFLVIGVLKKKVQNSSYNSRDKDRAFIPSTTFKELYGHRYINDIVVQQRLDLAGSKYIVRRIYEELGRKYVFDPSDKNAVQIWNTAEFFDEFLLFFSALNIFLVVMGAVTLAVGGLGVSNIMFVVVKERTREIGIKRAVGADRGVIMAQFFAETFFIVFVGAALGFLIAWGVTVLTAGMPENVKEAIGTPVINPLVALVSIAIIGAVGFVAGYFPARKASMLEPIECIRY